MNSLTAKKVLLIYFSLSGQTSSLVAQVANGLRDTGISTTIERLRPVTPMQFPFKSVPSTVLMMLLTFFRKRIPIEPLSPKCQDSYDLIILAGPTWSYHPSGPVLSLLDRDGRDLLSGQTVIPLISCRGYWRMHWYGLCSLLKKHDASVVNSIIFTHPSKEPWRTIGVFLKLSGKSPEKSKIIGKHYCKYGHVKEQQKEACRFGAEIGKALIDSHPLQNLNFQTPLTGCSAKTTS
ncbi:MAG: hypothetical protein KQH63_19105 [Desulfobulbaceae bacterium]|nr:hypothetical protein [Desulfobulbaceae bacterium]